MFEIGDNVRVVSNWSFKGIEGEVVEKDEAKRRFFWRYRVDFDSHTIWMRHHELERA